MDIRRLEQYSKIKREIIDLEKRIAVLQSRETKGYPSSTAASSPMFPYLKQSIAIVGTDESKKSKAIGEARKNLEQQEIRIVNEMNAIESFLTGIDDSEMRQIIRFRYIDGFSWQKIAFCMGKHDEQYPRRKHKSFFKKFEI